MRYNSKWGGFGKIRYFHFLVFTFYFFMTTFTFFVIMMGNVLQMRMLKINYFHFLVFTYFHFKCFCYHYVRYIANEEVAGRSGHALGKLRCIVRPPPSIPTPQSHVSWQSNDKGWKLGEKLMTTNKWEDKDLPGHLGWNLF